MDNDHLPDSSDGFISPGEQAQEFLRQSHGRTMAALSDVYPLPVDSDEIKRSEFHHRLLQFVFSGRNYIGPVKEALQFGQKRRSMLFHFRLNDFTDWPTAPKSSTSEQAPVGGP